MYGQGIGGIVVMRRSHLMWGLCVLRHKSHLIEASVEVLGAAEKHCKEKCIRGDTEKKCKDKGIIYQPIIFESSGGVASEAEKVIKCINRAVAENTDTPYGEVAQHFWQRLSVDIQRSGHRAFVRRAGERTHISGDWMDWLVDGALGLEGAT